jgi:hypothetical protein
MVLSWVVETKQWLLLATCLSLFIGMRWCVSGALLTMLVDGWFTMPCQQGVTEQTADASGLLATLEKYIKKLDKTWLQDCLENIKHKWGIYLRFILNSSLQLSHGFGYLVNECLPSLMN